MFRQPSAPTPPPHPLYPSPCIGGHRLWWRWVRGTIRAARAGKIERHELPRAAVVPMLPLVFGALLLLAAPWWAAFPLGFVAVWIGFGVASLLPGGRTYGLREGKHVEATVRIDARAHRLRGYPTWEVSTYSARTPGAKRAEELADQLMAPGSPVAAAADAHGIAVVARPATKRLRELYAAKYGFSDHPDKETHQVRWPRR